MSPTTSDSSTPPTKPPQEEEAAGTEAPERAVGAEKDEERVARATALLSGLTLVSRILGLVRDAVMAALLGSSFVLDAFLVAFTIPNLSRKLFGEGALGAAFIPVYAEEKKKRPEHLNRFVRHTLGALLLCLVGLTAALEGAAALGWLASDGPNRLLFLLLAILGPYALCICLVAFFGALLNSENHFLSPALAPPVLNVIWIGSALGTWALYGARPIPIAVGTSIGVLVGGVAQLLIQIPSLRSRSLPLLPDWNWHNPGLAEVRSRMAPMILGLAILQVNVLVDRLLAYGLAPTGSVTALYYANRLAQLPIALFATALATAIFPTVAGYAARGETNRLINLTDRAVSLSTFVTVPAALGLAWLAQPTIAVLFGRGAFDAAATSETARVLLFYVPVIWAWGWQSPITRSLYAIGDVRSPVRVGAGLVVVNLLLNLLLIGPLGAAGLALSTSITALIGPFLLRRILLNQTGETGLGLLNPFLRSLLPGAGMIAVLFALDTLVGPSLPATASLFLLVAGGALAYGGFGLLFRVSEIRRLLRIVWKKRT